MKTFDKYEFSEFYNTFSDNAFVLDIAKKVENSTFNIELNYAQLQYVLSLLYKDYHANNKDIDVNSFQFKLVNAFISSLLKSSESVLKGVNYDSK